MGQLGERPRAGSIGTADTGAPLKRPAALKGIAFGRIFHET